LGFPTKRDKKSIYFGPRGGIPVVQPRKSSAYKRKVHKTLIKNEI